MNKTELHIEIRQRKLISPDQMMLTRSIENCQDGKYLLTLKRKFRKASKLQFGYLFGFVHKELQKALLSKGWEADNLKDVEMICKKLFCSKDIINRDTGEIISIPDSRANFSTNDAKGYIDAIRNYAAENLGYYISEPDPEYWMKK